MTTFSDFKYLCGVLACAAALTGCDTTAKAPPLPKGPAPLADLLSQGSQAAATGQKEQAISVWKQAGTAYPADKAPWANIAQSRYDSGQYGEAIVAAQEVLLRDPNDKAANTIIAIGGLRLSTRALGDLNRQNNMTPQLRADAQEMAKLLRENMSDNTASVVPTRRTTPAARPLRDSKDVKDIKDVKDTKVEAATKVKPEGDKNDPFGGLLK
jgi:tetratricopeptide (TPR) repeat protein